MVIRNICDNCKGKSCCNRYLKLQSVYDEYSHLTNIIVDIECNLYRYNTHTCTAYGSLNNDIMFETDKFTQCNICLYKSVCKYDPDLIMRSSNEVLDRFKEIVDVKIACSNFHPNTPVEHNNNKYDNITKEAFCELLDLRQVSIHNDDDLIASTGKTCIDIFLPKDIPIDINTKNKHNKSQELIIIKIPKNIKKKLSLKKEKKIKKRK